MLMLSIAENETAFELYRKLTGSALDANSTLQDKATAEQKNAYILAHKLLTEKSYEENNHSFKNEPSVKNAEELSEKDLRHLLEKAQNGVMSDKSYIPLRKNTPEFFINVVKEHSGGTYFIEDFPIAATVEHMRQNMDEEDGSFYGDKRPHGLSIDDIVTVSRKMGNPSYIVLQNNGRYAMVVSFYNKRKKKVVVSIDLANSQSEPPKNYKYSQYMNGYNEGYYNIVVTQYEPDDFQKYLNDCEEVIYDKEKMNGKYQVGSGRVVTVTHDTPFIEDIISQNNPTVNIDPDFRLDGSGKLHFEDDKKKLTELQHGSLKALEAYADAIGIDIYIETNVDENINGWLDSKGIHISLTAGWNAKGTLLFTAAHELTHFIKKYSRFMLMLVKRGMALYFISMLLHKN